MNESELPEDFDPQSSASSCGATDCGKVREQNQDQFLIAQLNKSMQVTATSMPLENRLYGSVQGEVLLVADGMGGHAAGEKASHLAIEHFVRRLLSSVHWHFHDDTDRESEFMEDLQKMVRDAHARIVAEGQLHEDQRGMGTTLTTAYIIWPRMYVTHAGDSRCYLIRGKEAKQMTTDHTLARQMVEAGGLKPEEEAGSKWSNVLWNVLGGRTDGGDIEAEVVRVDLEPGDRIVLCSDGLHRYIDAERLAAIIDEFDQPDAACQRLIEMANEAGGEDNITVIVSQPMPSETISTTWVEDHDTEMRTSAELKDTEVLDALDGDDFGDDGDYDPLHDTLPE
ncbi:Serine/threonine phosphatase stp [Rubripirellula obstinata]|uniref:Serine/threonine phosphatase stp n=1 Tax=Rubripirellula obstinata TaxID=406547 RepID=A0A5B1CKN0_9BACT|nr:protein phosphatase 2C domain-containing protein [Rubripirellula obstinata]KAA1260871.1 Serine/threonine phosphatase stp [Rubripirellula obstinata]